MMIDCFETRKNVTFVEMTINIGSTKHSTAIAARTADKVTILLTGASGTVGAEALALLVERSEEFDVRVFDIRSSKSEEIFAQYGDKISVYYGDLSNPTDTIEITKDVDMVIHLASVIPPVAYKNPEVAHRVNVEGTHHLLTNIKTQSPSAFFVYSSSVAVYGDRLEEPYIRVSDPLQPSYGDNYGQTKVEAEAAIRNSGLDYSIFRLSAIMGVGNHKISGLMFLMPLETPMEITTPKDTARAFVHAYAHRKALNRRIFNLGGGQDCRVIYADFLHRNFQIQGIGALKFPLGAFAIYNYHCGYYADGDELEEITHFRRQTLKDHYASVAASVPNWRRPLVQLFAPLVRAYLLRQSEPYAAYRSKNPERMKLYFR